MYNGEDLAGLCGWARSCWEYLIPPIPAPPVAKRAGRGRGSLLLEDLLMQGSYTRRRFLKSAAAGGAALSLSAVSYSRVLGSNDRISIGIIGCGSRGIGVHMPGVHKHAESQNIEITAVCDPWRLRREAASAKGDDRASYF